MLKTNSKRSQRSREKPPGHSSGNSYDLFTARQEIVHLNCRIGDVTLALEMRKPFDLLAEGLVSEKSRGDWIRTSDLTVPNRAL
jgi:hypothetical protein